MAMKTVSVFGYWTMICMFVDNLQLELDTIGPYGLDDQSYYCCRPEMGIISSNSMLRMMRRSIWSRWPGIQFLYWTTGQLFGLKKPLYNWKIGYLFESHCFVWSGVVLLVTCWTKMIWPAQSTDRCAVCCYVCSHCASDSVVRVRSSSLLDKTGSGRETVPSACLD